PAPRSASAAWDRVRREARLRARSPLQHDERDRLTGQGEPENRLAFVDAHGGGGLHRSELAGGLELRVLLLVRRDRRAYPLPGRERVAVAVVDAVVLDPRLAPRHRQAAHRELDRGLGAGHVVVVIVPGHYGA